MSSVPHVVTSDPHAGQYGTVLLVTDVHVYIASTLVTNTTRGFRTAAISRLVFINC